VVYIGKDLIFDPKPGKTVHTIIGIKQGCCTILLDVGVKSSTGFCLCSCGGITPQINMWKDSFLFRPVQDQYTEEEIEAVNIDEILEPEPVEII